jgi:N-acyl-D-aspartate/D-glutamate deacylase
VFLLAREDKPDAAFDSLKRTAELTKKKCLPQVMPTPLTLQFTLHEPPISFSNMPVWKQVFGLEPEAQMRIYRDPAFRQQYKTELVDWMRFPWDRTEIALTASPGLKSLVGKTVQQIADERGQDPIDVFLDLSVEDNLKIRFNTRLFNVDHEKVGTLITDSRTLLGLSDAGAHIDVFCTADYCTHLLGTWVRELKVLSLERAVQRITAEPADFFGIRDRGRLAVGLAGDVVLFDPETVASSKRPEFVNDFPGKLARLVSRAEGIRYTIVNGQVLLENGATTSAARPGKVLRSHHVR